MPFSKSFVVRKWPARVPSSKKVFDIFTDIIVRDCAYMCVCVSAVCTYEWE